MFASRQDPRRDLQCVTGQPRVLPIGIDVADIRSAQTVLRGIEMTAVDRHVNARNAIAGQCPSLYLKAAANNSQYLAVDDSWQVDSQLERRAILRLLGFGGRTRRDIANSWMNVRRDL